MTSVQDILVDLINFKTDDDVDAKRACVDYICGILESHGCAVERVRTGKLENIVAGCNIGELRDVTGCLLMSGHMDVVGANPKEWRTDPFRGIVEGGRVCGRGAVDMKAFIACALSLLPAFKEKKIPVVFCFTCDEETACDGVKDVVQFLKGRNVRPAKAVLGEMTNACVGVGHRGYQGFRVNIVGKAVHSSTPDLGVNALYVAAKIIGHLERMAGDIGREDATLSVTGVVGKSTPNIVPDDIKVRWSIRAGDEKTVEKYRLKFEQICQGMVAAYPGVRITMDELEHLPAFKISADNPFVQQAVAVFGTKTMPLPYASEAGYLQEIVPDLIVCGPGDPALAHTSQESISVRDLEEYASRLKKLCGA